MVELLVERKESSAQISWNILLNNTSSYSFACNARLNGVRQNYSVREFYLNPMECRLAFSVPAHFIEDHPSVDYEIARYSLMGYEGKANGKVKIRAVDFVKKIKHSATINAPCITYKLNQAVRTIPEKTKIKIQKIDQGNFEDLYQKVDLYNTEEIAKFDRTLDLHIEKLVGDPSKINPNAAFMLQLNALKTYMDKAIRLGVDNVFIIHGLGKGKLKQAVADYAESLDVVAEIKNEFHPKYGFGATEIIFI